MPYNDLGQDATIQVMVEELKLLWKFGITVNGICWRVAIVNGIWDGKGYEKVTKTMGSGSINGCNVCDFHGIYFGHTQKYPFYYRYTNQGDSRRLKRPTGVQNASSMYNLESNVHTKPKVRTYAEYIHRGKLVENEEVPAKDVGINGIWYFNILPYSHLLHPTKDIMHSSNNIIEDSCRLMKPTSNSQPKHTNRTTSVSVIASCREYRIFPFLTKDQPDVPWILTNETRISHDRRFEHVLGFTNC